MAWSEFYIQPTGSNLNSGSTASDAASLTYASGAWASGTGVFTPASGNPASDGVQPGDWVSVYANGSSNTGFIAQVTAASSTAITVSATVRIGTAPADGTGTRTLKAGGAWADVLTTMFGGAGAVAVSTRINVKAGVYAGGSTSRTLAIGGTTTNPLWWRGYRATPGDMDNAPVAMRAAGTDIPSWTFTTGQLAASGAHQIFSAIDVAGARTASQQVSFTGAGIRAERCRFENTGANALSSAVQAQSTGTQAFVNCWFRAAAAATKVFDANRRSTMIGCVFEGGGVGYDLTSTSSESSLSWCVFLGQSSHGIRAGSAVSYLNAIGCGFSVGGDGIRFDAAPTSQAIVGNCVFRSVGGYGINNASGANTNLIQRSSNAYWAAASGQENGMGDSPRFNDVTEVADPWTSSTDPTLVAGALAWSAGFPGLFENQSFRSYPNIGPWQGRAGGAGLPISRLVGGL